MASKYGKDNYFKSVEDIYKRRLSSLVKFAHTNLVQHDQALDVVHDALTKTLVYLNRRPKAKISEKLVRTLIFRACTKKNNDKCGITLEPVTDFTEKVESFDD